MDWERARRDERSGRSSGIPGASNRRSRRAAGQQKPVNPRASNYPPTPEQLAYLRALSARAGVRYTPPRTRRQASARIKQLLQKPST